MTFAVGLTGGIGSGKTSAAQLFAARGAGLVDTDEISHRLTAPGKPAIADIAQRFGPRFVCVDGGLDRAKMRDLVFADPSARKDLEAILHPLIRRESEKQIRKSSAAYIIIVVPLLIETGAYLREVNRILVVDCDPETQTSRVMARSRLSRAQVLAIIASQVPRSQRLRAADDVIDNNGDPDALEAQVNALHRRYLGLAHGA